MAFGFDRQFATDNELYLYRHKFSSPTFTNLTSGDVLQYNGTHGVNVPGTTGTQWFRGYYDPTATSDYPTLGGSGSGGQIIAGDTWVISADGYIQGDAVQKGDELLANITNPELHPLNWTITEKNIGYVPENVVNKSTDEALGSSDTLYPTQKAVKSYADTKLAISGGTLTGNLNGATPTEIGYLSGVTSAIQTQINNINAGLSWKQSCRVATTANITLSGTQTIDGVSVIAGDRVLVKNQTTGSQNGIYVCASDSWSRSTDATTGGEGSTGLLQATMNVEEGTTNGDTMWTCSTNAPITVGSTSLTFVKTSNTTYTAGTGLSLSSNAFSIDSTVATLTGSQTLTNKTLTASSNVIGGVTMTLGSDAANDIYYRNSSGVLTRLANGTTGQVLTATTGSAPSWTAAGGGVTTVGTFSSSSITNGASISGATITLGVADGTNPGMISTTTQAIKGAKTFTASATTDDTITMTAIASQTGKLFTMRRSSGGEPRILTVSAGGQFIFYEGTASVQGLVLNADSLSNNMITTSGGNFVTMSPPSITGNGIGYACKIIGGYATDVQLYVQGKVSQTADLQQWANSSGTALAKIDATGIFQNGGATRVSTQFDKTNTTLANITGLTSTLIAGKTYQFEIRLHVTADTVGGLKVAIGGTCTATNIIYQIEAISNTSNALAISARQTALGGSSGVAQDSSYFVRIEGVITVNAAGTLTAQFAQNASNGTSSVLVGSSMVVQQIV